MFTMKCPSCGAESKFSFVDNSYEGPRRCWKCRGTFRIKISNNVLIYCEPIPEEEFIKVQELYDLRNKYKKQPPT
jgi:NAD-dependent SIR2 family protein deacetylase